MSQLYPSLVPAPFFAGPVLVIMTQPAPGMHSGDLPASELDFRIISLHLRVAGFVYTLDFFYIGSTIGQEF